MSKSFMSRMIDQLIEGRMRQANRYIQQFDAANRGVNKQKGRL